MSIDSYEGLEIGEHRDYAITESTMRPPSCRFEAHPKANDGTVPSVFGKCIEELRAEIGERYREADIDAQYGRR